MLLEEVVRAITSAELESTVAPEELLMLMSPSVAVIVIPEELPKVRLFVALLRVIAPVLFPPAQL